MNQKRDQLQHQTRAAQQTTSNALDVEAQADGLLGRAHAERAEQAAMLDTPSIETQYASSLAALVESKHDQVERIEDRLESLIEQQSSRLQQARAQRPSLVALPSTKTKWQQQIQQHQSTITRLQNRLEMVREIKGGMGVHGPRVEEMAERKLRLQDPGLADEWDDRQAEIRRQQVQRRRKDTDEQQQATSLGRSLGGSQSLVLAIGTRP